MTRRILAGLVMALLLAACNGGSVSDPTPVPTSTLPPTPTATAVPAVAIPSLQPAAEIELPAGFTIYRIADEFFRPTAVAVAPDGTLYVAVRHDGVFQLRDNDGDGFFEQQVLFLSPVNSAGEYDEITGLVVDEGNRVYIGDRARITIAEDLDGDGVADSIVPIIEDLPIGRHQNDGLVFGPDGMLYIAFGSSCDECVEEDPMSASILRANADGSGLEVYATGIRNSYDITFDAAGRLWASDNGSDGLEEPFCETIDELNLIEEGVDYGWPYAPECDAMASGRPPVASLGLHTGSTGIEAYRGSHFPSEYSGDLFLTLWGSFAFPPEFAAELYTYTPGDDEIKPFSTGFENPIDVLTDLDGTLLLLDYGLGALFRIVYTGG